MCTRPETTITTNAVTPPSGFIGYPGVILGRMRLELVAIFATVLATACVTDRTQGPKSGDAAQEYLCFAESSPEKVSERANAAARRGWRLVVGAASEPPIWCLERSRPAE